MRFYDSRMNFIDNVIYLYIRPGLCKVLGHKDTCYKIVPTEPQEWVYICHRCVRMEDAFESCGQCNNGCDPRDIDSQRLDDLEEWF